MICKKCGKEFDSDKESTLCEGCQKDVEQNHQVNEVKKEENLQEGDTNITEKKADDNSGFELPKVLSVIFTIFTLTLIALCAFSLYLFNENKILCGEVNNLKYRTHHLAVHIQDLEKQNDIQTKVIKETNDTVQKLKVNNYFQELQHFVGEGVVSEDFVVSKLSLYVDDYNMLSGVIDLRMQAPKQQEHLGKGEFTYSDKELRKRLESIVQVIGDTYNMYKHQHGEIVGLPNWEQVNMDITILNYDIGRFVVDILPHLKLK